LIGGDQVAERDVAAAHAAIDWREHFAEIDIQLLRIGARLVSRYLSRRDVAVGHHLVEIGFGCRSGFHEWLISFDVGVRLLVFSLSQLNVGIGFVESGLVRPIVDFKQNVALLHFLLRTGSRGVSLLEDVVEGNQIAADACPHFDRLHGIGPAGILRGIRNWT
jgi:hypothetical protein